MNRSIAMVGVGIVVAGIALLSFPLAVLGREEFDYEQIAGLLVVPIGLVVILIGAVSVDPNQTTVTGTFGNPDEAEIRAAEAVLPVAAPRRVNPNTPVHCRYCRSIITADLAQCPRCARARDCRTCGRPLGQVLDRPTCPRCARVEAFCNCPHLVRPIVPPPLRLPRSQMR